MGKTFRYELQKGSKHILCPKCGKKTFKPYVDSASGHIVNSELYGRCERIMSCQYLLYPPSAKDGEGLNNFEIWEAYESHQPPQPAIIQPDFIDKKLMERTFSRFRENVFFMWLVRLLGEEVAFELQETYNIGTAKGGGTIFWQQDREGRIRTGKVMYYGSNGKRYKNQASWYIHNKVKKDYNLKQVFFGEHLMDATKPIALCESEKTAILMSVFRPEFTWLASGGANMLNLYRLARLFRLDFVAPDNGQFQKWQKKTALFEGRQMDITVDRGVRAGIINPGADILDLHFAEAKLETTTTTTTNLKNPIYESRFSEAH